MIFFKKCKNRQIDGTMGQLESLVWFIIHMPWKTLLVYYHGDIISSYSNASFNFVVVVLENRVLCDTTLQEVIITLF